MTTSWPMKQRSPIQMPSWSWKRHPELMKICSPRWMLAPKSVVKGGKRPKDSGTARPVIRSMRARISSGVRYPVLSSAVSLWTSTARCRWKAAAGVPPRTGSPASTCRRNSVRSTGSPSFLIYVSISVAAAIMVLAGV